MYVPGTSKGLRVWIIKGRRKMAKGVNQVNLLIFSTNMFIWKERMHHFKRKALEISNLNLLEFSCVYIQKNIPYSRIALIHQAKILKRFYKCTHLCTSIYVCANINFINAHIGWWRISNPFSSQVLLTVH